MELPMHSLRLGPKPARRRPFVWVLLLLLLVQVPAADVAVAGLACTVAVTNIAFGNVDVSAGAAVDSTATITLNCTETPLNTPVRMCVSIDGGSAWDATSRQMNGPSTPQLRYQLYSDASRTNAWGSWPANLYGGGITWDITSSSVNLTATKTIYGRVLANQQTIPAGSYSSALTLFLTYEKDDKTACPNSGKGSATASFTATATVLSSCTVSATNLNFGTAGTLASQIDATSTATVQCASGAPYTVGLSAGSGSGATVSNRKMTLSGTTITYSLYSNAARTSVWGTTIGTDTVAGTGTGSPQNLTVYGRVPVQTTPAPGTYTDTIVVTVTY